MSEWLDWLREFYQNKLPIAQWFEAFIIWVHQKIPGLFNWASSVDAEFQSNLQSGLGRLEPEIWAVILSLLVIIGTRSILASLTLILTFVLTLNLKLWDSFMEVFVLWAGAFIIGGILGLLVTFILSRWHLLRAIVFGVSFYKSILIAMVFLIPSIALFKTGVVAQGFAALIVSILLWISIAMRIILEIPQAFAQTAQEHGGSHGQQFLKIELPYAVSVLKGRLGTIALGVWSISILSGLIGPMGFGRELVDILVNAGAVTDGANLGRGFEITIIIALTSVGIYRVFNGCWIRKFSGEVMV